MPQRPVGVTIYRPFDHEVPWNLLDGDCRQEDLDFVRVAKREEEVLGVYRLQRISATSFELVHLLVQPAERNLGIGWWLACHGLGLAEAKGGRIVQVAQEKSKPFVDFFARLGFISNGEWLTLELLPE